MQFLTRFKLRPRLCGLILEDGADIREETSMSEQDELLERIAALEAECARLRRENAALQQRVAVKAESATNVQVTTASGLPNTSEAVTNHSPASEKVALFRRMFRGREDVYALRWTGRDGKSGYSPAAWKGWSHPDAKGRPGRTLLAITDDAIVAHLTGKQTIGVYPLLQDETCRFLAADFDKGGWQEDARAFLDVCAEWKIPAALERSRSGRGTLAQYVRRIHLPPLRRAESHLRRRPQRRLAGGARSERKLGGAIR